VTYGVEGDKPAAAAADAAAPAPLAVHEHTERVSQSATGRQGHCRALCTILGVNIKMKTGVEAGAMCRLHRSVLGSGKQLAGKLCDLVLAAVRRALSAVRREATNLQLRLLRCLRGTVLV